MEEIVNLFERIDALLAEPVTGGAAEIARVEHTLTEGYARALALEAERWRLERRIGEVAARLAEGDRDRRTNELAALAARISNADGDLSRLRGRLASLRHRVHEVRTAPATA
jgi:septal ring factor EnvC (AmiA/AmiB activator)